MSSPKLEWGIEDTVRVSFNQIMHEVITLSIMNYVRWRYFQIFVHSIFFKGVFFFSLQNKSVYFPDVDSLENITVFWGMDFRMESVYKKPYIYSSLGREETRIFHPSFCPSLHNTASNERIEFVITFSMWLSPTAGAVWLAQAKAIAGLKTCFHKYLDTDL